MTQLAKFLLIFLSAFATLIQAQAKSSKKTSTSAKPTPTPCVIKDIRGMDVSNCVCAGHSNKCHKKGCKVCVNIDVLDRDTTSPGCATGCTDNDRDCKGCGLWFSTICDCIKYPNDCQHPAPYVPQKDAVFILTPNGEQLVTTTDLVPGILEMLNNPGRYEPAWQYAQDKWAPGSQALALNSVRSRTHEQIHIHLCNRPNSSDPRILEVLDAIPPKQHPVGNVLQPIGTKNDLFCRVIPAGQPSPIVTDFIISLQGALHKVCAEIAGAAIIRDSYHNIWACLTGYTAGPLSKFCEGPK